MIGGAGGDIAILIGLIVLIIFGDLALVWLGVPGNDDDEENGP